MRDKVGRCALWVEADNSNGKPVLTGNVEIGPNKYRISFWANEDGPEGSPTYTGSVETMLKREAPERVPSPRMPTRGGYGRV